MLVPLAVEKMQSGSLASKPPANDVEKALSQGFAWLRFPRGLEARFLVDKAENRLLLAMMAEVAMVMVFPMTLIADWYMTPDVIRLSAALRLIAYPCITLAGLQLMRTLRIPALNEWLMAGNAILTIGMEIIVLGSSHAPWAMAGVVILNLIAVCTCSIARFWPSTLTCLCAFAAHTHLVNTLPDPTGGALPFCTSLLLLTSSSFALYGNYKLEHGERMAFLLGLREARLDADLLAAHAHIQRIATTDALTGLANRHSFDTFLGAGLTRAQTQGLPLALLMIDIDYFKRYNDLHGHQAGDACLVKVAHALSQSLRRTGDLVARWGGEEFMVIMVDADANAASAAAERMRLAVQALNLPHPGSPCGKVVTVSMGLCAAAPDQHTLAQTLCALTDEALYRAKAQGRNQVCIADAANLLAPQHSRASAVQTNSSTFATSTPASVTPDQSAGARPLNTASGRDASTPWGAALQLLGSLFNTKVWRPNALVFDPEREVRFQEARKGPRLKHLRVSGAFALLTFDLFLLTDRVMVPDAFDQAVWMRLVVFTPATLVLMFLLHFARPWVLSLPATLIETTMTFTGVAASLSLGWLVTQSSNPMALLYPAGLVPVLIYGNIIQRFRFGQAQVFSAITLAVTLATTMLRQDHLDTQEVLSLPLTLLVGFMALHSLMMNYRMESDERERFSTAEREAELRKELATSQAKLETLARKDALTGIPNRRHADAHLQTHWSRLHAANGQMGLLLLDVDHFKAYNDRYGHPAGDQCLQHVAKALAQHVAQANACVGRWGGEEFIVILPGATGLQALQVAQTLQRAVQATALRHEASGTASCVTVSIGAASCQVSDPAWRPDALIAQADQALYQAKAQGRNCCVLAGGPT